MTSLTYELPINSKLPEFKKRPSSKKWENQRAISKEAITVETFINNRNKHTIRTRTLLAPQSLLLDQVQVIRTECSVKNWDSQGAVPLKEVSIDNLVKFLEALPDNISMPEILPEPDGYLTAAWVKNGYHIVFGLDEQNICTYGGITPATKIYGDFQFDGKTIPQEIEDLLKKIDGID